MFLIDIISIIILFVIGVIMRYIWWRWSTDSCDKAWSAWSQAATTTRQADPEIAAGRSWLQQERLCSFHQQKPGSSIVWSNSRKSANSQPPFFPSQSMFLSENLAGLLLLSPSLIVDAEVDEETMEGAHFCHGQELIQWQHSTLAIFIQLRGQWGHLSRNPMVKISKWNPMPCVFYRWNTWFQDSPKKWSSEIPWCYLFGGVQGFLLIDFKVRKNHEV